MAMTTQFFKQVLGAAYNNVRHEASRVGGALASEGTRKGALRMIGAHAAAGAVVGGTTEGMRGRSVMRGAMVGGVMGGALGRMGGLAANARNGLKSQSFMMRAAGVSRADRVHAMGGATSMYNRAMRSRAGKYLGI